MANPQVAPKTEDLLAAIRRRPGVMLGELTAELNPPPTLRMLLYALGVLEEQQQIVNVGTPRVPRYRVAAAAPGVSAPVAPATPARSVAAPVRQTPPPNPVSHPVAEQRLGATAIGVDREQVTELVDLILAAGVPSVAVKPYVRQAAAGLPNANEFVAAVLAELARRGGPTA